MIEVADLCSVHEQNSITQPIETVCKDDFALGSLGNIVEPGLGHHLVADTQVDLTLMRVGEGVWLPERHVSIIAGK